MKKGSMLIHPDELSEAWIRRLSEAGIATLGLHPVGGRHAVDSLKELLGRLKTAEYRALLDTARRRGLAVEYELHAAGYLMPRELFSEHPDYFRQNEAGERTADYNFCVSNPEALSLFARRAAALAGELYQSSPRYYFWMDDGHDCHCFCPKCRTLSPSDQQMIALTAALREIRKNIPEAKMAYLAYYDSLTPPKVLRGEEGIFLEYAPLEKYTAKGEGAVAAVAAEQAMLPPLLDFFKEEPPRVLEYWYDNSLFSRWKKPPQKFTLDEERMQREMKEYFRLGFSEIASFACFLGEDYEALHGGFDLTPFARCLREE